MTLLKGTVPSELQKVYFSGEFSVRQAQREVVKIQKKFDKTQNNDLFISPKRKKTVLEMGLKSSILSKFDHLMSKSWKEIAAHELKTNIVNLTGWKTEYLSSGQDFGKKFIVSKHVLKVFFKPSRKNLDL